MENTLNAIDALKIAIKQEQDGFEYYTKAAKKIKDKRLIKIVNQLADDEHEHEKTFKDLLTKIKSGNKIFTLDYKENIANFLSVFVDTVFNKKKINIEQLIDKMDSDLDILDHAISNEKDTLIFFIELKNLAQDQEAKLIFEQIISEERKHIISLTKAYSEFTKNVLDKKSR